MWNEPLLCQVHNRRCPGFIGDKVPDHTRPISTLQKSRDGRSAYLSPFDDQVIGRAAIRLPVPVHRYSTATVGKCAVLCCIGGQLVKDHGYRLTGPRVQYDFGTPDLSIVARGIRCELAPNELCQRYSLPPT